MKQSRIMMLAALAAITTATSTVSGQVKVDLKKFPEYSPRVKVDKHLVAKPDVKRPDYVNNAESIYFPPIISQVSNSCGSAAGIYYMFGYEINRYRGVSGKLPENQYPTHFTWLHAMSSYEYKEKIAMANGIPNNPTYGGQIYSSLFGMQECSDNDFGWMQGYDKWYSAMFNRLESDAFFPQSVKTEEGREAVKQWLWNHGGNPDYPGGGICNVDVASKMTMGKIPASLENYKLGVTGKKYVARWGDTFDHELTLVGYDDRIEFDLDGNAVIGEKDKDEVGAWILVNSWGGNWANKGFIYCPYKNAVVTSAGDDYYVPQIYYVRRNYRPLRTMRIKMDYSKRSELRLSAGISEDLNATTPQKTTYFEMFKFSGNGDSSKDAETPMLGRWADGMHYEPMEFGYDLTDLSSSFNTRKPLKYFFIIESKATADGVGHVYDCSVIDYELDTLGIETLFPIDKSGIKIENKGKKTIISFVVSGENFNAPRNLVKNGDNLQWEAPEASSYKLSGYNVYRNDTLVQQLDPSVLTYKPRAGHDSYQVCAAYAYNDKTILSSRIDAPRGAFYGKAVATGNRVRNFINSGLVVKDLFKENYPQATIEYWLRPNSMADYNQQVGPGWGKVLIHATSSGQLYAGWSTSSRIESPSRALKASKWNHIAVVFNGGSCTAYINGVSIGEIGSGNNGIGGFGDFNIGAASREGLNGRLDEFRVWSTARTQREIQSMMYAEVADPTNTPGLLCEIKMNEDKVPTDATGRFKVETLEGSQNSMVDNTVLKDKRVLAASFTLPENITTGMAVTPINTSSANAISSTWTIDGKQTLKMDAPTVIFSEAGEHTITLEVADMSGKNMKEEKTFTVAAQAKPDALFTSVGDVAVGKRISFINATMPYEGCSYEWSMPGSTQEKATTVNAATSYEKPGTYTVTLKATNAAGTSTYDMQIVVSSKVPTPEFEVTPRVILKGETAQLQDGSSDQPAAWDWTVSNADHHLSFSGQTPEVKLLDAGVYNVTLEASNALGSKSITKPRAIVVCNADAENGLKFRGGDEQVSFNNPIDLSVSKGFTIDWWMYAQNASGNSQHIGGTAANFQITTNAEGALVVTMKNQAFATASNFVTASEWHHYAVCFENGDLRVFKDGKLANTFHTPFADDLPTMPTKMSLGNSAAPMSGVVDEFRVWNKALSAEAVKAYANAPIADVAKAMADDKLALYYDFNQSSGNVNDRTSNANLGIRSGFGPDGDAWPSSLGVFSLSNAQRLDITAEHLTNYAAPFLHADKAISNETGMEHLVALLTKNAKSGWNVENATVDGGVSTTVAVDTDKDDMMTLWTAKGNFSSRVTNHKLYQTVTLPAGHYVFGFEYGEGDVDDASHIVVAKGTGLPNKEDLGSQALAYTLTKNGELAFDLDDQTEVSLGIVFNTSGEKAQYVKRFFIERKITNQAGDVTGIELPTADGSNAVEVTAQLGGVNLTAANGALVRIVRASGITFYNAYVKGTRFVALPKGIYLVNGQKVLVP